MYLLLKKNLNLPEEGERARKKKKERKKLLE